MYKVCANSIILEAKDLLSIIRHLFKFKKSGCMKIPYRRWWGSLGVQKISKKKTWDWSLIWWARAKGRWAIVRILSYFSRWDNGPRKSNWIGEDDDLKQNKQIKVEQFLFSDAYEFSFLEEYEYDSDSI